MAVWQSDHPEYEDFDWGTKADCIKLDLYHAEDMLMSLLKKLKALESQPFDVNHDRKLADDLTVSSLNHGAHAVVDAATQIHRIAREVVLNRELGALESGWEDRKESILKGGSVDTYAGKQALVRFVNEFLRITDLAVSHPVTGKPSILYALQSRNGNGRFTFEDRETKKRQGSFSSLGEILPLRLVPDIPRKEGVIERRKKKPGTAPDD